MMKKFIITLTLLFLVFFGFSQGVIVRTTGTQTVEDMRLMAGLNFYVPVYPDTTTANLTANKGIDSAGALIFCRDINGFRIRRSNPKRWDYVTDSTVFSTITALKDSAAVLRALITSSTVGAGGNNTDIQFNNHGAFGGDDNLQYDGTNLLVGVSKNVALKKGDYLYFNGVDTTWKIQLITTSGSDHIITGNELRLSIPTTSEGFSINNGAGVPSFQVQGNSGLAYIKGDLQIGAYQLPNTDGINGQVLITNGTGNAAWTTIPATGITALTGDVTASGTGSVVTTLATVNSTPNTFGDSTKTLVVTVNGKGLVTSVVSKSILISQSQILNPNITGLIAGGTNIALSGSGTSGSPYVINSTAPGTGTVTSITAGAALTGGTITTSGTIGADTSVLATKTALIDSLANYVKAPIPNSSLQHSAVFLVPSNGITVGSSGILTLGNTVAIGIDTTGTIATTTALKDTAAAIRSSIGSGSVTSIATTSGILGGTITSTGTLKADTSLLATKSYVNQQDTTINAGIDLTQTYSGSIKSLNADTTTGNTKLATQGFVSRSYQPLLTLPLSIANGGTGTASPSLVAGTNVTITGSFPNQTINASGGGSGTLNNNYTFPLSVRVTGNYAASNHELVRIRATAAQTDTLPLLSSIPDSASITIRWDSGNNSNLTRVIPRGSDVINVSSTVDTLFYVGEVKTYQGNKSLGSWTILNGNTPHSAFGLTAVTKYDSTTTHGIYGVRYNANAATWINDTFHIRGDSRAASLILTGASAVNGWGVCVGSTLSKSIDNGAIGGTIICDTPTSGNLSFYRNIATLMPKSTTGAHTLLWMFGYNDANLGCSSQLFASTTRKTIDSATLDYNYSASSIYILFGDAPTGNATLTKAYHDSLVTICSQKGVNFVDFYAYELYCVGNNINLWADGIHENTQGNNVIAGAVEMAYLNYAIQDSAKKAQVIGDTIDCVNIRIRKGVGYPTSQSDIQSISYLGTNKNGDLVRIPNSMLVYSCSSDTTAPGGAINITGNVKGSQGIFSGVYGAGVSVAKNATYLSVLSNGDGFITTDNGLLATEKPMFIGNGQSVTIGSVFFTPNADLLNIVGGADFSGNINIGANTVSTSPLTISKVSVSGFSDRKTGDLIAEPVTAMRDFISSSSATIPFVSTNTFSGGNYFSAGTGIIYSIATGVFIRKPITGANITITDPYALIDSGKTLFADTVRYPATSPGIGKVITCDANSNMIWSTAPSVLSTTTGINAKSTGTTALYTVPTGKTLTITSVVVHITASSAITNGATASIDSVSNAGYFFPATSMTALTAIPKNFTFVGNGMGNDGATGTVINFNITSAATGTSQTLKVDLIGYLQGLPLWMLLFIPLKKKKDEEDITV